MTPTSLNEALAADLTSKLRLYLDTGRKRTDLLKEMAELIVTIRSRFTLSDGRVDWSGRSPEYRSLISECYSNAGVPPELYDTVQTTLRYHVGNLVRERVSKDSLIDVGIRSASPRERLLRNRLVQASQLATLDSTGRANPLRLTGLAEALLHTVADAEVERLSDDEVEALRLALVSIEARSSALRRKLPRPRRGKLGPNGGS